MESKDYKDGFAAGCESMREACIIAVKQLRDEFVRSSKSWDNLDDACSQISVTKKDDSWLQRHDDAVADNALEMAARVADEHWPESGHVHQEDAISCQMSISIQIRRLKSGVKGRLAVLKEAEGK